MNKDFSGWKRDSGEKGEKQHRSLHFEEDEACEQGTVLHPLIQYQCSVFPRLITDQEQARDKLADVLISICS